MKAANFFGVSFSPEEDIGTRSEIMDVLAKRRVKELLNEIDKHKDPSGKKLEEVGLIILAQYYGGVLYTRRRILGYEYDIIVTPRDGGENEIIILESKARETGSYIEWFGGLITRLNSLKATAGVLLTFKEPSRNALREYRRIIYENPHAKICLITSQYLSKLINSTETIKEAVRKIFFETRIKSLAY